ncbi:MAG TPA: hypothetical protein VKF40_23555 [Burkholderiales bacterium]|nr:hypothetical protein [Burkholderiales bacterium]
MREPKYAVLALAVIFAAGGAAAAYSQSTSGDERNGVRFVEVPLTVNRDEQAAAVIRSIDSEKRVIESSPISSAELARGRAAGEIQATERSDTRILPEGSGNARAAVGAGGQPDARTRAGTQPDLEIVRAGGEDRDRAKPQAVIRIDDVARSREHARYEAEKKRRAAGKPAPDVNVSDSFSGPAVVELR